MYIYKTALNYRPRTMVAQPAPLTYENKGKKYEVLFQITKGQILTNIGGNHVVRIKFDEEKPLSLGYSGSSDYRDDVIFLRSAQFLLTKFKKAKKAIVEIEFYQDGAKQFYFDVAGLK